MKKHMLLPALAVIGGICGAILRFLQNQSGFEPDTGLPIPGNLYAFLLPGLLLLTAILATLLCLHLLPREHQSSSALFDDYFSTHSTAAMTIIVAGIFLWCISGAAGVIASDTQYSLTADGLYYPVSAAAQRTALLLNGALVVSALCMFAAAAIRRFKNPSSAGNLLLVPVVYLILRLTLSFREMSINASQQAYYVELLAMVFLSLSLFRLSSFAFQNANTRRFALYSIMSTVLCITALADASALSDRLFYGGGACLTAGFLLFRLSCKDDTATQE